MKLRLKIQFFGGRGASSVILPPRSIRYTAHFGKSRVQIRVSDTLRGSLGVKGKPYSMDAALERANPGFSPNHAEYSLNCQRAVVAFEMLSRGYNVNALNTYKGDDLPKVAYVNKKLGTYEGKWKGAFKGAKNINVSATRTQGVVNNIEKQMKSFGDGSRAVIQVFWKNGGGHVFNAVRKNGKTYYVDAQTNKHYKPNEVISKVVPSKVNLVRTDNLRVSDRMRNFVTKSNRK